MSPLLEEPVTSPFARKILAPHPGGHFGEVLTSCHELCALKNLDYGPENITQAGLLGLIIRMGDKYQRLLNLACRAGLTLQDIPEQTRAKLLAVTGNESVRDTFMDMLNYSGISITWLDGNWGRPHEEMFGSFAGQPAGEAGFSDSCRN